MLIYLVRWPDLSASLVQADGEEHLLDILDQVGNPDDCEWNIYNGPLFIDFRLPVEWSIQDDSRKAPAGTQQIVVGDVGRIADGNVVEAMQLSLAEAMMAMRPARRFFAWHFQSCMLQLRSLMS